MCDSPVFVRSVFFPSWFVFFSPVTVHLTAFLSGTLDISLHWFLNLDPTSFWKTNFGKISFFYFWKQNKKPNQTPNPTNLKWQQKLPLKVSTWIIHNCILFSVRVLWFSSLLLLISFIFSTRNLVIWKTLLNFLDICETVIILKYRLY